MPPTSKPPDMWKYAAVIVLSVVGSGGLTLFTLEQNDVMTIRDDVDKIKTDPSARADAFTRTMWERESMVLNRQIDTLSAQQRATLQIVQRFSERGPVDVIKALENIEERLEQIDNRIIRFEILIDRTHSRGLATPDG